MTDAYEVGAVTGAEVRGVRAQSEIAGLSIKLVDMFLEHPAWTQPGHPENTRTRIRKTRLTLDAAIQLRAELDKAIEWHTPTAEKPELRSYWYYRKVRSLVGRPVNDGDLYRVPATGVARQDRVEYWVDRDEVWVTSVNTTVGEILDGYNAGTHDRELGAP